MGYHRWGSSILVSGTRGYCLEVFLHQIGNVFRCIHQYVQKCILSLLFIGIRMKTCFTTRLLNMSLAHFIYRTSLGAKLDLFNELNRQVLGERGGRSFWETVVFQYWRRILISGAESGGSGHSTLVALKYAIEFDGEELDVFHEKSNEMCFPVEVEVMEYGELVSKREGRRGC